MKFDELWLDGIASVFNELVSFRVSVVNLEPVMQPEWGWRPKTTSYAIVTPEIVLLHQNDLCAK